MKPVLLVKQHYALVYDGKILDKKWKERHFKISDK
jgi:hypothetical protein